MACWEIPRGSFLTVLTSLLFIFLHTNNKNLFSSKAYRYLAVFFWRSVVQTCRCLSLACRSFLRNHRHLAVTMAIWPNTRSSFCKQQEEGFKRMKNRLRSSVFQRHEGHTNLAQNKLHIAELTVFPQFTVVLVQSALWVARELRERKRS